MLIAHNLWGGVLIGNVCIPASRGVEPKVLVNWVEFNNNQYHPALEIFSCQRLDWRVNEEREYLDWNQPMALTRVDISGNSFLHGTGMGLRMEPCVNTRVDINSNRFHNLQNSALLIRNAKHPQLWPLEARVTIAKNDIKANTGQYIVSIGLNEDAPRQQLVFNQQNELRGNTVINPFPFLKPRSTPYAALVVSSSNVVSRGGECGSKNHTATRLYRVAIFKDFHCSGETRPQRVYVFVGIGEPSLPPNSARLYGATMSIGLFGKFARFFNNNNIFLPPSILAITLPRHP